MAIQSSPEVVREMKSTLQKTVQSITSTQQGIQRAMSASAGWNDSQGQQYQALMKRIAQLTASPVSTLNAAVPKLENLAKALDDYGRVRFG